MGFVPLSVTGFWPNAQQNHCFSSNSYVLIISKTLALLHKGTQALCLHNTKTHKIIWTVRRGCLQTGRRAPGRLCTGLCYLNGHHRAKLTCMDKTKSSGCERPVLSPWAENQELKVYSVPCLTASNLGSRSRYYQALSCPSGQVISPSGIFPPHPVCAAEDNSTACIPSQSPFWMVSRFTVNSEQPAGSVSRFLPTE